MKVSDFLVNCLINIICSLYGKEFMYVSVVLPLIDIALIPVLFRKYNSKNKAILSIILMLLFVIIQVSSGFFCNDNQIAVAFMLLFTTLFTILPLGINSIVYIIKYPWEKENKKMEEHWKEIYKDSDSSEL